MNQDTQPYVYRRHVKTCENFGPGGRNARWDKCNCPFHADGKHYGRRVRQSLNTRSRQLAERRLNALLHKLDEERQLGGPGEGQTLKGEQKRPTLAWAAERFLKSHGAIDPEHGYRGTLSTRPLESIEPNLACFVPSASAKAYPSWLTRTAWMSWRITAVAATSGR